MGMIVQGDAVGRGIRGGGVQAVMHSSKGFRTVPPMMVSSGGARADITDRSSITRNSIRGDYFCPMCKVPLA